MRYRIEDCVVDTARSTAAVNLGTHPQGYGHATEDLYRSRRGRWYIVHQYSWTEDNKVLDYAEWLSPEEAARLLNLANYDNYDEWPEIQKVVDTVTE